jgi:RNA-directed DNA polymerase
MKRVGNLFEEIVCRENLRQAVGRALRGKHARADARAFTAELDRRLEAMAEQLLSGTFPVGRYRQFLIHDPKDRVITAPIFSERVLHHALFLVCEPRFESWLIDDTFACRRGKGRDAALARTQHFARRNLWFLKLDIRKYFDSVPHERLLELLERKIKDRRLLSLFERIVCSFRGSLGLGLPIGSLTSQHLANFYLGHFDRFIKEKLRIRGYVRYMDDMALFAGRKEELRKALAALVPFLQEELRLELSSQYLNRVTHGLDFLGCRVYRTHRILNRRSRVRFQRSLRSLEALAVAGQIEGPELQQRATALVAFTRASGAASWNFRRRVLESSWEKVEGLEPGDPGRQF